MIIWSYTLAPAYINAFQFRYGSTDTCVCVRTLKISSMHNNADGERSADFLLDLPSHSGQARDLNPDTLSGKSFHIIVGYSLSAP